MTEEAIANRITGHGEEPPENLLANPRNWRVHPRAQELALQGALEQVGWVSGVIVNRTTGHVVDGHLRVALGISRSEPSIPVTYVELSAEEEALVLASLDPLAGMAVADEGKLAELLEEVSFESADLEEALRALVPGDGPAGLTDPDEVPEPPKKPVTKPGDLWVLGDHRLLCGDSTKEADVARLMDGSIAQMTFTDPPYGVDYDGGAKRRERLVGDQVGTSIYADALPHLRVATDEKAPLYLWYADAHAAAAAAAAAAAGFAIVAQVVWVKNNAQFVTAAHYKGKHECCFYGHRRGKAARWHGPNNEVTVWEANRANRNEWHPTQKPVELAQRAIRNSSQRGDGVLDIFLGSGTTIIAAEMESRVGYGMEIDPAYCDVIVERWEGFSGKKAERG